MADRFEDERGVIEDLIADVDQITRIFTKAGCVRGNHVHHKTMQWTYVVSGELLAASEPVGGQYTKAIYTPGCLLAEVPGVPHAWRAVTDCTVLVFTQGPRSGENYESDTERLPRDQWLLDIERCAACHQPGELATTAGGLRVHMSCPT